VVGTGRAFAEIKSEVSKIHASIANIAVNQLDRTTQENAAMAEPVGSFRIDDSGAAEPARGEASDLPQNVTVFPGRTAAVRNALAAVREEELAAEDPKRGL